MRHTQAIRLPKVCERTGLAPATVWRKSKEDPDFPRPFKLGANSTAWDENEVLDWLEAKKSSRISNEAGK